MSSEIKELRVTHFDNGKKIMYLAKEFLLSSEVIYISGTTNSAGTAARRGPQCLSDCSTPTLWEACGENTYPAFLHSTGKP